MARDAVLLRFNKLVAAVVCSLSFTATALAAERQVIAEGLESPESVAIGPGGRMFVTLIGKSNVNGDGTVAVIEDGKAKTFAKGLDDPKGLAVHGDNLYVADKTRVWEIDSTGNATVYAEAEAFPVKPKFLNDAQAGPDGDIYVSDCGTFTADGAVFRIKPSKEIVIVVSQKTAPALKAPNGLWLDGKDHILVADFTSGVLYRVSLIDGKLTEMASGFGGADGLTRDAKGRIYVSDWRGGRIYVLESGSDKPKLLAEGFKAAADIVLNPKDGKLLVPDTRAGNLTAIALD